MSSGVEEASFEEIGGWKDSSKDHGDRLGILEAYVIQEVKALQMLRFLELQREERKHHVSKVVFSH